MTRVFFLMIIFGMLSLGLVSACEAQEASISDPISPQVKMQELEDSAREAFKAYSDLIRAGEFTKAADFYADDRRFVWVEDGAIKYDSKAQIQRAFEGIGSLGTVQTTYAVPTFWALNDAQVNVFVKFRTTIGKGSKKEFTYTGALTIVMEKFDAGWKFLSGHSSSTPESKGF